MKSSGTQREKHMKHCSVTIEYSWENVPEDCDKQLQDDLEDAAMNRACESMTRGHNCGVLVYSDTYSPPCPSNKKYHGRWTAI